MIKNNIDLDLDVCQDLFDNYDIAIFTLEHAQIINKEIRNKLEEWVVSEIITTLKDKNNKLELIEKLMIDDKIKFKLKEKLTNEN